MLSSASLLQCMLVALPVERCGLPVADCAIAVWRLACAVYRSASAAKCVLSFALSPGALLATNVCTASLLRMGDAVCDSALPANISIASVPIASERNIDLVMANQPSLKERICGAFPRGN